jgi:hypothetical protein
MWHTPSKLSHHSLLSFRSRKKDERAECHGARGAHRVVEDAERSPPTVPRAVRDMRRRRGVVWPRLQRRLFACLLGRSAAASLDGLRGAALRSRRRGALDAVSRKRDTKKVHSHCLPAEVRGTWAAVVCPAPRRTKRTCRGAPRHIARRGVSQLATTHVPLSITPRALPAHVLQRAGARRPELNRAVRRTPSHWRFGWCASRRCNSASRSGRSLPPPPRAAESLPGAGPLSPTYRAEKRAHARTQARTHARTHTHTHTQARTHAWAPS